MNVELFDTQVYLRNQFLFSHFVAFFALLWSHYVNKERYRLSKITVMIAVFLQIFVVLVASQMVY